MAKIDLGTYGNAMLDAGFAGNLVDLNTSSVVNAVSQEARIDFGLFVVRGTEEGSCKLPSAATDKLLGISVRHPTMTADQAGDIAYRKDMVVPVAEIGRIYVLCEDACNPGDPVHVRFSGTGVKGAARSAAVSNETFPATQAFWDSKTQVGQIGVIRILK
ncbi:MAG: hypothetical protein FWD77_03800 [Betaproteobacteria bacterium]|nr:hypothetical protein [Betaproteobacteria bacterium]